MIVVCFLSVSHQSVPTCFQPPSVLLEYDIPTAVCQLRSSIKAFRVTVFCEATLVTELTSVQ